MIKINRSNLIPAIDVYTKNMTKDDTNVLTKAAIEYSKAIAFFTDANHYLNNKKLVKKDFGFTVYKDKKLISELEKIFGEKCAYCESDFRAVSPKDIEHFRPKSEVITSAGEILRPGYYWMAGEWFNLLVSCPDCNRKRSHRVPGQPRMLTLGKHTQFPLANESVRLRSHTCTPIQKQNEDAQRLLIHPCLDDPEAYFTYDDEGLIYPKDKNNEKARCSIYVYALQRKGLVESRKKKLLELEERLLNLQDPIQELNALDPEAEELWSAKERQITRLLGQVKRMFQPGEPYLGLLRDYIRRHIALGTYEGYISAGINIADLLRLPVSRPLPAPRLDLSNFRGMSSRIPVGLRLR